MRTLLVVLLGIGFVASAVEVPRSYHDAVGIPLAASIKAQEDAVQETLSSEVVPKIVGGAVAPVNAHPYLAGLVVYFPGEVSACGASLLTSSRLVTAAHCWNDGVKQAILFEVVLGSAYLFYGGTRVQTTSVVMHPQWTPSLFRNDVAMIYLPTNVALSTSVQPIALPSGADLFESFAGQWSVAAGYGLTNDAQVGVTMSTVVSHVNLQVITTQLCQQSFGTVFVQTSNICTAGFGGVGICGGDSGGPLVVVRNGRPTLVGISQFVALAGCQLGHPSVFARITSFYSFILQHM